MATFQYNSRNQSDAYITDIKETSDNSKSLPADTSKPNNLDGICPLCKDTTQTIFYESNVCGHIVCRECYEDCYSSAPRKCHSRVCSSELRRDDFSRIVTGGPQGSTSTVDPMDAIVKSNLGLFSKLQPHDTRQDKQTKQQNPANNHPHSCYLCNLVNFPCDRTQPCGRCKSKGVKCWYTETGVGQSSDAKARQNLETRVEYLEDVLKRHTIPHSAADTAFLFSSLRKSLSGPAQSQVKSEPIDEANQPSEKSALFRRATNNSNWVSLKKNLHRFGSGDIDMEDDIKPEDGSVSGESTSTCLTESCTGEESDVGDDADTSIPFPKAGELYRKTRRASITRWSQSVTTAANGHGGQASGAPPGQNPSGSHTRPNGRSQKRPPEDDEDPSNQNGQDDPSFSGPRSAKKKKEEKRLACPFYKNNPREYKINSGVKFRTCNGPGWRSFKDVKDHITRRHYKLHCERCYKAFKNNEAKTQHMQQLEACTPRLPPADLGMTNDQRDRIKRDLRSIQDEVKKWKEMYKILFPNQQVPSPYYDIEDRTTPDELHDAAMYHMSLDIDIATVVSQCIDDVISGTEALGFEEFVDVFTGGLDVNKLKRSLIQGINNEFDQLRQQYEERLRQQFEDRSRLQGVHQYEAQSDNGDEADEEECENLFGEQYGDQQAPDRIASQEPANSPSTNTAASNPQLFGGYLNQFGMQTDPMIPFDYSYPNQYSVYSTPSSQPTLPNQGNYNVGVNPSANTVIPDPAPPSYPFGSGAPIQGPDFHQMGTRPSSSAAPFVNRPMPVRPRNVAAPTNLTRGNSSARRVTSDEYFNISNPGRTRNV